MAHYNLRRYDPARVEAELRGATQYPGSACRSDPDHVRADGTTMRDTVKYQCILCHNRQKRARNSKRRDGYEPKS